MPDCVCCACWWCNCCGDNMGLLLACCFAKVWCCKPEDPQIQAMYPGCCMCEASGWGANYCCLGSVWCAPTYIISKKLVSQIEVALNRPY